MTDLISHDSGDIVEVGAVGVELLHTPGHTPGSQCFMVDGMLVSGDTLFLEGCGRTDLPGSDSEAMYESLQRLAGRDTFPKGAYRRRKRVHHGLVARFRLAEILDRRQRRLHCHQELLGFEGGLVAQSSSRSPQGGAPEWPAGASHRRDQRLARQRHQLPW